MVSRHEIIMTNDTMIYNHNLGELQKEATVAKKCNSSIILRNKGFKSLIITHRKYNST